VGAGDAVTEPIRGGGSAPGSPPTEGAANASIDIGSNSLLLTVVDGAGKILHDEARVVGLGKGLGDRGVFRADRMAAGAQVLRDYVKTAGDFGVAVGAIQAVATSGARRATNADAYFAGIFDETGLRIRTISGDEEARLTWIGAQRDLAIPRDDVRLVIDLGGGSTEVVVGTAEHVRARVSLEFGTVRLTEAYLCPLTGPHAGEVPDWYDPAGVEALRKAVDAAVTEAADLWTHRPTVAIAVAGTATTLAAMHLGLVRYDGHRVHGSTLDHDTLVTFADRLQRVDAVGRRAIAAISPARADYLLAGSIVLERVREASGCAALRVSDRGLRFALLP
jgi:exopolyphosphatase/guanosine-5'-triphosphate,3'-diphosphate pyrophosphatase